MTPTGGRPARLVVVAGTGTGVGKTWITCRLVERIRARGRAVSVRKPVQSHGPEDDPNTLDAALLAASSGEQRQDVCPPARTYAAAMAPPMAADRLGRPRIALADLVDEVRWPSGTDLGLVETVGGVRSPIAHDGDSADLAAELAPDVVVLVADAGLGTVNAVRLAAGALAPLRTVVVLNHFDPSDDLHRRNQTWLADVDGFEVWTDPAGLADALLG